MWKISTHSNLSDFIIVGDVDTSRHTRTSKGEDIKAAETNKISRKQVMIFKEKSPFDLIQDTL